MASTRIWDPDPNRAPLSVEDLNKLFSGASSTVTFVDASDNPVRTSDKFRRTIFVGIGGTGQRVLRRLKARMSRYGLTGLPCFAMVALDTAPQESVKNDGSEVALDNREYVCAQVQSPQRYLAQVEKGRRGDPCAQPELAEWLPQRFTADAVTDGAASRRAVGRFAFFVNAANIIKTMSSAVERVSATEIDSQMATLGLALDSEAPTTVYIVGSICGGTGSGMLLDATYQLRELLSKKFTKEIETNGVIVTAFPRADDKHRANAYAALTEISYFSLSDTVFEARYPGNPTVRSLDAPFNTCYLIGNTSESGEVIQDIHNLSDMLAEALFLMSCTDASSCYSAAMSNIKSGFSSVSLQSAIKDKRRPDRFSSLGVQTCVVPKDWIVDKWGSELCVRLLDGMISNSGELSDKPIVAAASVADRFGMQSAATFTPLQRSDQEMHSYALAALKASITAGNDAAFWMKTQRENVAERLPDVIADKGKAAITEELAEFIAVVEREAGAMFTSREAGGVMAGNQFISKVLSDISTLKADIAKTSAATVKPAETYRTALDQLDAECRRPKSIFRPKADPAQLDANFKNHMRNMIYNDWRREAFSHVLAQLDELELRLRQMQGDMEPALRQLERVKSRFAEEWQRSTSSPTSLPVFAKSLLNERQVNDAYWNSELGDTARQSQLFVGSLSSVTHLANLTEEQIYYAMRAWARACFDRTLFSVDVSSIINDAASGEAVGMETFMRNLQNSTNVYWSIDPSVMLTSKPLNILSSPDHDGVMDKAWSAAGTMGSEWHFAPQNAITDKLWVLKSSHGGRIDALTELDWCWESFQTIQRQDQTTYLFSHKDYAGKLAEVMVRPDDTPSYANSPRLWALALAHKVIEKSQDPQYMDMYIATLDAPGGRVRKVELAKNRAEAYELFDRSEDVQKQVTVALEALNRLPAEERLNLIKNQSEAVSSLLGRIAPNTPKSIVDLLELEFTILREECAKLEAEIF